MGDDYYTLYVDNEKCSFMNSLVVTNYSKEYLQFLDTLSQSLSSSIVVFVTNEDILFHSAVVVHATRFTALLHYYLIDTDFQHFKDLHKKCRENSPLEHSIVPIYIPPLVDTASYIGHLYDNDDVDMFYVQGHLVTDVTVIELLWSKLKSHGFLLVYDVFQTDTVFSMINEFFTDLNDITSVQYIVDTRHPVFLIKKPVVCSV